MTTTTDQRTAAGAVTALTKAFADLEKELSEAYLDSIEEDREVLEDTMRKIEKLVKAYRSEEMMSTVPISADELEQLTVLCRFQRGISVRLNLLSRAEVEPSMTVNRVEAPGFGVATETQDADDAALLLGRDMDLLLDELEKRVMELFRWHNTYDIVKKTYLAPYFPLIQSSGTGKTKLLWELKRRVEENQDGRFDDYACRTILCFDVSSIKYHNKINSGNDSVFSHHLRLPIHPFDTRDKLLKQLDEIVKDCLSKGKTKIILLSDEAHLLLKKNAHAFLCVRWWLRSRYRYREEEMVAVLCGCTAELASPFHEPPVATTSRCAGPSHHESGDVLFSPLVPSVTMGVFATAAAAARRTTVRATAKSCCLTDDATTTMAVAAATTSNTTSSSDLTTSTTATTITTSCATSLTDYERAIPYGRPLFAVMQQQHKLTPDKLSFILQKMLLGASPDKYTNNHRACISILGTRFQMGHLLAPLSLELVAKGYAMLTHYDVVDDPDTVWKNSDGGTRRNGNRNDILAHVCFPQDPVCARLAMAMMDEEWSIDGTAAAGAAEGSMAANTKSSTETPCRGQSKEFWTSQLSDIYSTGHSRLNTRLENVCGAMYLVFCGDVLRKRLDPTYHTFSVSLWDYVDCLLQPRHYYYYYNTSPNVDSTAATTSNNSLNNQPISAPSKRPGLVPSPTSCGNRKFVDGHVGFIQIISNHLRFTMSHLTHQELLEAMYTAGLAFAMYPGCHVHLVASIRLTAQRQDDDPDDDNVYYYYVPLLVRFSRYHDFEPESDLKHFSDLLEDVGAFGMCLTLLLAPQRQWQDNDDNDDDESAIRVEMLLSTNDVDHLLNERIVSKALVVLEDDPFGIVKTMLWKTLDGPERAGVYGSHPVLACSFLKHEVASTLQL